MILNQSWGIFFFSDGMKRTLVSGYRSHFCVMVSDITVVPRLSDLFVLNCLKSYGQGYSDMPSRDLMQTNCRGCYLKIEKLWTSALLSDYLLWSFLQCPSDIKKKKCTFHECRTNEGKSAFKITSLWVGSSEFSAQLSRHQEPSSLLHRPSWENHFFWADVVFCPGTYALTETLLLWLGYHKIYSKPFHLQIYWFQGRKDW